MRTILIDSSAISEMSCKRKFYYKILKGYAPSQDGHEACFGNAFHRFRKHFRQSGQDGMAAGMEEAVTYFKNANYKPNRQKAYLNQGHLISVCNQYAARWGRDCVKPLDRMLELKFNLPYRRYEGFEILLSGTIDEVSKIDGGIYCITDAKTTSAIDAAGFLSHYALSQQLLFYVNAVHLLAALSPESIYAQMVNTGPVGAMVDGVFLNGKDKISFQRSEVFLYRDELLFEFRAMLDRKIMEIVEMILSDIPPMREGIMTKTCSLYGNCMFFGACAAVDNFSCEHVLNNNFRVKQYNPMEHQ